MTKGFIFVVSIPLSSPESGFMSFICYGTAVVVVAG